MTNKEFEALDLSRYSESEKREIESVKKAINLTPDEVITYGSQASKNLTEFSSSLLKNMQMKDNPEVEGLIGELMDGLRTVDATTLLQKKPTFWSKLFRTDDVEKFKEKYQSVSTLIEGVKDKLDSSVYQLRQDMNHCNIYIDKNGDYIAELDKYIMAGRMRIKEETDALTKDGIGLDTDDNVVMMEFRERKSGVERLERRVFDLMLMREIATQNMHQMYLIRDGDGVLVEKIQSSISSVIPLWEQQMVSSFHMLRQRNAVEIQKNVRETTNKLIEKNSQLLKENSLSIGRELEAPIVDIEVLKKSQQTLIETVEGLKQIHAEGRQQRMQATKELEQLQSQFAAKLLLEGEVAS